MKKTFSLLAITATLFFVSCKKENIDQPGGGGNQQPLVVKKLVATNVSGYSNTITYNVNGMPSKITRTDMQNNIYDFIFTYSPGKANYVSNYNGKKSEVGEITLVNGKATTFVWTYFDAFENPINTFTETFGYNAKGLLSKRDFGSNNVFTTYSYDNNDNVIESIYHSQGQAESKSEFTYTNKKDLFPSFGLFDSYVMGFFLPAKAKNLMTSRKGTDLLTNTVSYHETYAYDLDSDGYVTKGTIHSVLTNQDYIWTNTFQ